MTNGEIYRCYICEKFDETIRLLPCLHLLCSSCLENSVAKYLEFSKNKDYSAKQDNMNISEENDFLNNDSVIINKEKITEPNYSQYNIYEDIDLYVLPTELEKIPVQPNKRGNIIYSKFNTLNKETFRLSNLHKKIVSSLFTEKSAKPNEYEDLYMKPDYYKEIEIFSKNENNFFNRSTTKSVTSTTKDKKKYQFHAPKLIRRPKIQDSISIPNSEISLQSDSQSFNESKLEDTISLEIEESIYLTPGIQSQIQDGIQEQYDKKDILEFPCPQCQEKHKIPTDFNEINTFPILCDSILTSNHNNNKECCLNFDIKKSINKYFVCVTCQLTVCSICVDKFHKYHYYESTETILNWENSEKKNLIEEIKIQIKNRLKNQQSLENKINKLENRKLKSINKITKYRDYLIESINNESLLLISEIEEAYDQTKINIKNTIKEIDEQINMFKYTIDFSNFTIKNLKNNTSLCNKLIIDRLLFLRYNDFNLDYNKRPSIQLNAMNFNAEDIRVLFGLSITEKLNRKRTKFSPEIQKPMINSFKLRHKNAKNKFKPSGIVIPNNEEIIIVDDIDNKIKYFNSMGFYKKDLIMPENKNLSKPCCISFSQKFNELYVTDQANVDLKIFSLDSGVYKKSIKDGLLNPWGVVVNSSGNIIISDLMLKKLLIFDRISGNCLYTISLITNNLIKKEAELNYKVYLCLNINNDIIASDFIDNDVKIFNFYGQFISSYKLVNHLNLKIKYDELKNPRGIAVDINTGNIFVADFIGKQIVILNAHGLHIKSLRTDHSNFNSPLDISFDSSGKLFVIDGLNFKVFMLDEIICEKSESNPPSQPKKKFTYSDISIIKAIESHEMKLAHFNNHKTISLSENNLTENCKDLSNKYKPSIKRKPTHFKSKKINLIDYRNSSKNIYLSNDELEFNMSRSLNYFNKINNTDKLSNETEVW